MEVLDTDLLSYFPDYKMRLIVNHHDQVMQLPEGATPLATSDFCRYEGFRIGHYILTFQGHPEFSVEYERHLIVNHSENEDDTVKQRALKTLEELQPQGEVVARFLVDSGC
jgi:GMP synthase-like glutamine amidotransferase